MKRLYAIIIVLALFLLQACSPVYKTIYHYQLPEHQNGKRCLTQCMDERNYCYLSCYSQKKMCKKRENWEGYFQYRAYVYSQEMDPKLQALSSDYFNDPSSCQNVCPCVQKFNSCFQTCGGKVTITQNKR